MSSPVFLLVIGGTKLCHVCDLIKAKKQKKRKKLSAVEQCGYMLTLGR